MRLPTLLRATVLAATLAVPLAPAAIADPPTQEASTAHIYGSSTATSTGPYSNDAVMSPAVGD